MLLFVLYIALLSTSVQSWSVVTKVWVVNTNVTIESRYWDDLVTIGSFTFNGSMTHAVAIPTVKNGLEECELIYPLDKLPASVSSDLYNSTQAGECVDEKLLKKMDRVFWLDPRNWARSIIYTENTETREVIPHTERIPCDYDQVMIPDTINTFIILPPNPIKLTTLQFGRRYVSQYTITNALKRESILQHFITKSNLNVADTLNTTYGMPCEDRTGCECGMDIYEEEICAFVKDDCAKNLPCEKPIKPIGHCCPICGGAVIANFDRNKFVYNRFVSVVRKFVKNQSNRLQYEIDTYISKITLTQVQVILLPKYEYSNHMPDLTNGLIKYLDNKAIDLEIEGCILMEAGKPKGDQRSWLNIIVGLAITLIVTIVLVLVNNNLTLIGKAVSFCKGLSSSQFKDDENLQNKSTVSKEKEIAVNHTEKNEKVALQSASVVKDSLVSQGGDQN